MEIDRAHHELKKLPSRLIAHHTLHENVLIAINAGGKGTQFRLMKEYFAQDPSIDFKEEGMGNYCRGVIAYTQKPEENGHFEKYAEHIEPHLPMMAKGDLLPDPNIVSVARLAYADQVGHLYSTGGEKKLVLGWDGFPRTEYQFHAFDGMREQLAIKGVDTVRSFLYMELPDKVVMERTINRVIDAMLAREGFLPENFCKMSQSVQRQLMLDNFDRAIQLGIRGVRKDDHPDTIPNRIETFKRETLPVVDLAAKIYGIKTINGDQDANKVHADIVPHLTPTIAV